MPKVRKLDYAALLFSLTVIVLFSYNIYSGQGEAFSVKVESEGREWIYPLDRDRIIRVEGPIGITEIHIENNSVYIHDSPCPDKLCVMAGKLDRTGQWAACLPNRIFVSIEGNQDDEIDDLNY